MKKKDIIALMEYQRHLIVSGYGKKREYYMLVDKLANPMDKIMDIKELKDELDVIKNEFERMKEIRKVSEDYVSEHEEEVKNIKCDHPIVFGSVGLGYHYRCALCDKEVNKVDNRLKILDEEDTDDYYYPGPTTYHEIKERYEKLYNLVNGVLENLDDEDEVYYSFKEFLGYKASIMVGIMTKVKK